MIFLDTLLLFVVFFLINIVDFDCLIVFLECSDSIVFEESFYWL